MTDRIEAPGFIDIQINGGWGHDFTTDPESIWHVGRHLPSTGVTAFVPTIITAPYDVTTRAISVVLDGPPDGYMGARCLGLHIEGPWISPEMSGAHPAEYLRLPDVEVARTWAESGAVSIVTMAPELEGAGEVASVLSEAGVVVSAGHSNADVTTASAALDGVCGLVTHLFNQMSPFNHREPGLVGAALTADVACGLIVDGIHSDSVAVQLAWDVLGPDRLVLVSDAMAAAGLGEGTFDLGDTVVTVDATGPRTEDGRLAGSALTLDRAAANLMATTGATLEEVLPTVTSTPAGVLKLDPALTERDWVVLGDGLEILETVIDGEVVFGGAS